MKNIRYLSFTEKGENLADMLAASLGGKVSRCGMPQGLEEWTAQHFLQGSHLVFIGAVGIAVRAIAPHLKSKTTDPAVVVVDECAHFAVPLISGHLGGANDLARAVSEVCGAVPVLTTATDANGIFAVDEWARRQNCQIVNPEKIKGVSAKLLAGEPIAVQSAWPIVGAPPQNIRVVEDKTYEVLMGVRTRGRDVLRLVPRIAVLGVGCKKETSREALETALKAVLGKASMYECAITTVATIDLKNNEPGLLDFCAAHGWDLKSYTAAQLKTAKGEFTPSAFVQKITGVDNVCERSAVLASGGIIYQTKNAGNGVTMAIALSPYHPDWRWQNEL